MRVRGCCIVLFSVLLGIVAPAFASELEVRALLVPVCEATLSSRMNGQIVRLPVKEGDRFKKGDQLVEFDCELFKAELEKARMDLEAATETHQAQQRLQKYGSTSELEVAVASARRKRATAEVLVMETKVGMCGISAPFNGRVVKRRANPHENVSPDDPILEILDDSQLQLHLLVPSNWLRWLTRGENFTIRVDETGGRYQAIVSSLAAKVNPVNQTLEVKGTIVGRYPELLAGMSGVATFEPATGKGKR